MGILLLFSNFAPVNALDMSSKANADIYVLGDASHQGDMPKSGFSANSQAKVCANAVRGLLTGSKVFTAKFSNICWSLVHKNDGIKVGATDTATDEKIAKIDGFISATNESADLRKATYKESGLVCRYNYRYVWIVKLGILNKSKSPNNIYPSKEFYLEALGGLG